MPIRIPTIRLPPTSPGTEPLAFAAAGALALAPLYMALPGAAERVAAQTARWGPRWERGAGYLAAPAGGAARRAAPPARAAVASVGASLPLGPAARGLGRRIRSGIDRAGGWNNRRV